MVLGLKKKDTKGDVAPPSHDKAPSKYEKYVCKLTPQYKQIAAKALHESDAIRGQALDQLREWIAKDSNIKAVRTDPIFLLSFLRTGKYNVPTAFEILKRYMMARQQFPQWYRNLDVMAQTMNALFDAGFLIPLPKKDDMGRQVMIYNVANLDPTKFTSDDVFRLQECVYQTLFQEEECQVAGFVFIFDYSAITLQHVAMFSLVDFRNFLACVRKAAPIRICNMKVVKMPTFLTAFYEITMNFLSPKLRQRFKVYKTLDEFQRSVDVKIFPKEFYDGEEDTAAILADFKKRMIGKREVIRGLDLAKIEVTNDDEDDWFRQDNNGNIESGMIGSFRKLEVD